MATTLLDTLRSFVTPELVDRASTHLGESSDSIHTALSGAIPAVLAGYTDRAELSDAEGLLQDAKQAASHDLAQTAGTMFAADRSDRPVGTGLGNLFAERLSSIPAAVASFAGIKPESANSLLSLLAPLGLGVIGRHAIDNNLDADGLRSLLVSQKPAVLNALPPGLSIGNLFGPSPQRRPAVASDYAPRTKELHSGGRNWLWWVLGLAVLALLVYLLTRGNRQETSPGGDTTSGTIPYNDMKGAPWGSAYAAGSLAGQNTTLVFVGKILWRATKV